MFLDKKAIEETAVEAVKEQIRLSPILSSDIACNDKTPSYDGSISIHKDEKQTKDGIKVIRVQVKGHETTDFSSENIKHPVKLSDLRTYQENGGCFYFVVFLYKDEVSLEFKNKIYYQSLTPVRIFEILSNTKAKNETNVEFLSFPRIPHEASTILLMHFNHCLLQAQYSGKPLPKIEELEKSGVLEELQVPMSGYGPKPSVASAFMKYDTYMYARIKNCDALIPVSGTMKDKVFKEELVGIVSVNGTPFYNSFRRITTHRETTIRIGSSFVIRFPKDKTEKQTINYTASNSLRTRVKDQRFICACLRNMSFEIDGVEIKLNSEAIDYSSFDIEKVEEQTALFEKYVKTLDLQMCSDDIEIDKLTQLDRKSMSCLADATIDGKTINGIYPGETPFSIIRVEKLQFAMYFIKDEAIPDSYHIGNICDYSEPVYTWKVEEEKMQVPVYIALNDDNYANLSNLKFDNMLPAFKRFEMNSYIYEITNNVLLHMINGADKAKPARRAVLLQTALKFAEWLSEAPEDVWDSRIATLNRLQIIKRLRSFTDEEKDMLLEIIETSSEQPRILFGAYVLLEQKKSIVRSFSKMSKKDQREFMKYPITHLWKQ